MDISEVRRKYPQYEDMSDQQLAEALHRKYYSDMDFSEFSQKIGLSASREGGRANAAVDLLTGENRATAQTDSLPELQNSGLLSGESRLKTAAITPALLTATDPNEIADIITSNFPNVGVTYNKDGEGNVFPILVNNESGAATVINRPGISAMDALQGLGLAAAFTPAGRGATALGVGARSAATEAALQGTQEASGGDFSGGEVALAGGLGAAGKALESAVSTAGRFVSGKGAVDDVVQAGKDTGIPVLTSDVLRPESWTGKRAQQYAAQIPFIGTGGTRAAQQELREDAVNSFVSNNADFSYDAIVSSLKGTRDRVKRAAGNVLEKTGRDLDGVGEVDTSSTFSAIQKARDELARPGVMADSASIAALEEIADTIAAAPQTFTMLKTNRTAVREMVDAVDQAGQSQMPSRAKALMTQVYRSMTDDMERFAKDNLPEGQFAKWKRANQVYSDHARLMTKSRLKNVLDKGDITPEAVETMLFSQKPSELRSLYGSLGERGRSNARAAIISRVVRNVDKRKSGLSANSFATELKKYQPQINTFFKGEELKQIKGLQRVLEATQTAQDLAAAPPTGQALMHVLLAGGAVTVPVETVAIAGTLAGVSQLYESAPVRNALIRLASVPKGSTKFDRALQEVFESSAAVAQAMRAETDQGQQLEQQIDKAL